MWNQPGPESGSGSSRASGSGSSARDAMLSVGAQAPRFLFWEDPRDHEMQLHAMNGRPVVVAFSRRWSGATDPVHAEALAAELRGLGAALIVVTAESIWLHQPDDPAVRYEFGCMLGTSRELVHHSFGLRTDDAALFVLDTRNIVRWRSGVSDIPGEDASRAVLAALHLAGESLRITPPSPLLLSQRELVLSSLIAAFALLTLPGSLATITAGSAPL